jgi:hypothetical protein
MSVYPSPTAVRGDHIAGTTVPAADPQAAGAAAATAPPFPRPSGLFAPSPLVASESSAPTDEPSAQCAAPSLLPESLGPIAPAVVELQQSAAPHSVPASVAESAKWLASSSSAAASCAHPQASTLKDGRENREKQISFPSSAPIGSAQRAMLVCSSKRSQPARPHVSISSPSFAGLSAMDMSEDDDTHAASAATVVSTSLPVAAASGAASSSMLPAASNNAQSTSGRVHPSRVGQLNMGGAAVPPPIAARPSRPTPSASSGDRAPSSKGSVPSWFALICSEATLQQQLAENSAASAASSPLSCDPSAAFCLVVDPRLFPAGTNDAASLHQAIAARSDLTQVETIVAAWKPQLTAAPADMMCAFVNDTGVGQAPRLHVQFNSQAGMAHALHTVKCLVPCCVTSASGWGRGPCGPLRHRLPERVDIECKLTSDVTDIKNAAKKAAAIKTLLSELNMEQTDHWIPSNEKPHRFVLSVLPRAIELVALTNLVNRINTSGFQLFGLRVRASAPNCSSLARCTQCGLLGHSGQSCTQYRGVACRVVMREPASYRFMIDLKKATNAPRAYLGQDLSERSPHRLITLLFDGLKSDSTAAQLMEIGSRGMTRFVLPFRDLVADVRMVNVRDRLQECKRCGSMVRPHQCQLHEPGRPFAARRPDASSPLQRAVTQSHCGRAAAVAVSSNVCKSWRLKKSCPRLDSNRRCNWQHPADHTVSERQICYDFRDTGLCARGGGCKFSHSHMPAQAPPALDAPAPSPPASVAASHQLAPASAAAAAAPAPALAPEAPAEAPFTQVPPRRRGRQPAASPSSAAAASTQAAAAAPVSASHKKRKVATAELRTPLVTPERSAGEAKSASAVASPPSDVRGWGDECGSEKGELQVAAPPRSASPARGSIAMSSLSSLPSPLKSAAAAATPKHTQRKQRVAKAAASTLSDSSSSASAARGLSRSPSPFRPPTLTAAASSSLSMCTASESDQASSNASNHQ